MLGGVYPYDSYLHPGNNGPWWVPVLVAAIAVVGFAVYAWRVRRTARMKDAAAHDVTALPTAHEGRKAA